MVAECAVTHAIIYIRALSKYVAAERSHSSLSRMIKSMPQALAYLGYGHVTLLQCSQKQQCCELFDNVGTHVPEKT